ncbi:M50 family metallopeptidase [Ruania halotolerans]|uniref:M50 family metallopeptidase n=1 Tax=Ruania halotolerans TaxID=2897773 RepID=UPI001E544720|nr:M50 family metallopeptidase [Ruania halotolerans]UFU06214.1 M50 family metallopeptidase [Ruania halotolerans]
MDLWNEIVTRAAPSDPAALSVRDLAILLAATLIVVSFGPIWRLVRLAVTLVHELGHAVIGILAGRRFTGFVLRMDASGHAVTHGRAHGPGRILTTWAGYPAPAVVGAGVIIASVHGWAAPVLALALVILLGSLIRIRSVLTAVVMLAVLAGIGALWWFADARWQSLALLMLGAVLLLGAWRHLGAVARDTSRGSDPAVLAALTPIPRLVWMGTFVLVLAGSTWLAGSTVRELLI